MLSLIFSEKLFKKNFRMLSAAILHSAFRVKVTQYLDKIWYVINTNYDSIIPFPIKSFQFYKLYLSISILNKTEKKSINRI